MPLTREERKLLHQKSKQPTFGSGKPDVNEGYEGDVAYRDVPDSGLVQYVKDGGDWVAVASSGEMPPVRIVGGGSSSATGAGVTAHSDLSGLSFDDHTQYLLIDGSRAMTGNLSTSTHSIVMTPSTDDTITIAGATNGALSITTVDNAAAAANIQITADGTAELAGTTVTLDSSGDIALSADGDQITMDDGSTTRFTFNVDSTPEIDVTGAFILDGSSTIRLDAVSNIDFIVNSREVFKADTTGHIFLHTAAQNLEEDYSITMKSGNYPFTTGVDDFQQNYSWVGDDFVSTAYNTGYGS